MKNKIVAIILVLSLIIPTLCGCSKSETTAKNKKKSHSAKSSEAEDEISEEEEAEMEGTPASKSPTAPSNTDFLVNHPDYSIAISDRPDLADSINHNRLQMVNLVDKGLHSGFTFTLESYMADPLCFCFFVKLSGDFPQEDRLLLHNIRITDADTGEELDIRTSPMYFDESGTLYFGEIFWNKACTNFDMDADLLQLTPSYDEYVLESYHWEFRNVEYAPLKTLSVDKDYSIASQTLHIRDVLISENCTQVRFDNIPASYIYTLNTLLLDDKNDVLAAPSYNSPFSYEFKGDDGNWIWVNLLNSIYYRDVEDFTLYISDFDAAISDGRILKINARTQTAEYDGRIIDIKVYTDPSQADFDLSSIDPWGILGYPVFLVPSLDLPEINAIYDCDLQSYSYMDAAYPHITIDGTDYIVLAYPEYYSTPDDSCYFFVSGKESQIYDIYDYIDLKMSDAQTS